MNSSHPPERMGWRGEDDELTGDAPTALEHELEPQRARWSLSKGILYFRVGSLVWMLTLNLASAGFSRPWLAYLSMGAATAWTTWLWIHPNDQSRNWALRFDLVLTTSLILASAFVVPHQGVISPHRLFFATAYPVSTPLMWGMSKRAWGGLGSAVVMSMALFFTRPLNGITIHHLTDVIGVANGAAYFLIGGYTIGVIANALDTSAASVQRSVDRVLLEQQRVIEAQRLAAEEQRAAAEAREREAGVRRQREVRDRIHRKILNEHFRDILPPLQARAVSLGDEQLVGLAKRLQRAAEVLRYFIERSYEPLPPGLVLLEDVLRERASGIWRIQVDWPVSYVCLPYAAADHLCAAVELALQNVDKHAKVDKAIVNVLPNDEGLLVSVLDHGEGFDTDALKGGIGFQDMEGHISALDGVIKVESRPGGPTVVEFHLPVQPDWVVR